MRVSGDKREEKQAKATGPPVSLPVAMLTAGAHLILKIILRNRNFYFQFRDKNTDTQKNYITQSMSLAAGSIGLG